jgi:hypothetical protein
MPRPKPDTPTIQIAIRIPAEWAKWADDLALAISRPGMTITRTDAFRVALAEGLTTCRQREREKGKRP